MPSGDHMTTPTHETDGVRECGCPEDTGELSRRSFLAGAAATGALTGLVSAGLSTSTAFAATPYHGDVMVVLSLRGGMDGLNVVVPTGDPDYHNLRPTIGIKARALLPLEGIFGLHPAMKPLMPWWRKGKLGFVHAVGQQSPSRSHFQAMADMEAAAPGSSLRTGWLDRTLGLRARGTSLQGCQVGSNLAAGMFIGPSPEMVMTTVPEFTMHGVPDAAGRRNWTRALRKLQHGAPETLRAPTQATIEALGQVAPLQRQGYRPRSTAHYPNTELGQALKSVAWLIKARVGLQVAAVDYGDWDMHAGMGRTDKGWLHDKMTELSQALNAFALDLGPKLDNVTLITLTEFGRRAAENGSQGTDHGHGQAVMLLGGGVRGGRVHGAWPGLRDVDLDQGDLAGPNDYRALLAEILEKRCGAGTAATSQVFPGLSSDRIGIVKPR